MLLHHLNLKLIKVLNSASKWSILYIVYNCPGLSGRKIAYLAGMGWVPVRNSLEDLCHKHLIFRKKRGRAYVYFPNEDHILYPLLKRFFGQLDGLYESLYGDLEQRAREHLREKLIGMKVTLSTLYCITPNDSHHLRRFLEECLHQKGLTRLFNVEVVPYPRVRERRQPPELFTAPGPCYGNPIF